MKRFLLKKSIHTKIEIAKIFLLNCNYDKCIKILEPILDLTVFSIQAEIYCKALYYLPNSIVILKNILEGYRSASVYCNTTVIIELEIFFSLKRRDKLNEISSFALKFKPNEKSYIYYKLLALFQLDLQDELLSILESIDIYEFRQEVMVLACNGYFVLGKHQKSLEIAYHLVQRNRNYEGLFFNTYLRIPDNKLEKEEIVKSGLFLRITDGNSESEFKLTDSTGLYSKIVGLKLNDEFEHEDSFTQIKTKYKIIGIYNKIQYFYLSLLKKVNTPDSNIRGKMIHFDSNNLESIQNSILQNIGKNGADEKLEEEKFNNYFKGILSFSELLNQASFNNFFDLYLFLTKNPSCKVLTIPYLVLEKIISSKSKYLLDLSTIKMIYDLENEGLFESAERYSISSFTKSIIDQFYLNDKNGLKSDLMMQIKNDQIIPVHYSKEFYERRSEDIAKFKLWIDKNIDVVNAKSFIDSGRQINNFSSTNDSFKALLDSSLLAQEDYLLLSNDSFYFKYRLGQPKNICNPLHYIKSNSINFESINRYLISNNYIGIELSKNILLAEYKLNIEGKINFFQNCVDNLNFNLNPNLDNLLESVKFIKEVLINRTYAIEQSKTAIEKILHMILSFRAPNVIDYLILSINSEFVNNP
ncbi:MAG: hypothetical protein IPK62_02070 [Bacteroidetes bacterium]|nr:hypothetical protein [Bacteroidota bacterium]